MHVPATEHDGPAGASEHLLDTVRTSFRDQRALAERALAQLEGDDWHVRLDPESNSIAIVVRHLAGNMRSRWTDLLTSDGEKPWRDRDGEFAVTNDASEALLEVWHTGWDLTLKTLDDLRPGDLTREVTIRGEPHSVAEAVVRQLAHYAQHVGQIVMLAKHVRGDAWRSLSLPTPRREVPEPPPRPR
ncbi:MAG: DUF1572 domain-containing protein [Trueperaceae bacterium]|nr:MAG: DUF1572 domain-containing protein [Trueperaceae bacterium]